MTTNDVKTFPMEHSIVRALTGGPGELKIFSPQRSCIYGSRSYGPDVYTDSEVEIHSLQDEGYTTHNQIVQMWEDRKHEYDLPFFTTRAYRCKCQDPNRRIYVYAKHTLGNPYIEFTYRSCDYGDCSDYWNFWATTPVEGCISFLETLIRYSSFDLHNFKVNPYADMELSQYAFRRTAVYAKDIYEAYRMVHNTELVPELILEEIRFKAEHPPVYQFIKKNPQGGDVRISTTREDEITPAPFSIDARRAKQWVDSLNVDLDCKFVPSIWHQIATSGSEYAMVCGLRDTTGRQRPLHWVPRSELEHRPNGEDDDTLETQDRT